MAMTRIDETDLLLPLHEGLHEDPRWSIFLNRLRRRTRADYAALIFRQGYLPMHQATEYFVGRDLRADARRHGYAELLDMDPTRYDLLRPGRVYGLEELASPEDAKQMAFRQAYRARSGISSLRLMRVSEPGGISAWAILACEDRDFSASEASLLAGLAPHLAVALKNFAALESARLRLALSEEVLERDGAGWLVLDAEARLIDASRQAERLLRGVPGTACVAGARLAGPVPEGGRALQQASAAFALDPRAPARVIRLSADPVMDLLAAPWRMPPLAARSIPVLFGLLRGPRRAGAMPPALLESLFDLSSGEARLARALAEGRSIAEAAEAAGITVQTARFYSKQLYAKTLTHGQADLVRLVLGSVAALG